MKTFLFSFNVAQIDPEIVRARLNSAPEILDWLVLTGGLILVKSEHGHDELAMRIRGSFPSMQFLVTEAGPTNCDGWMPQPVWDFINQADLARIAS
jgi:hypothetical protein